MNEHVSSFLISSIVYLNNFLDGNYINILTVNSIPEGPFSRFVSSIENNRLSHFESCKKCVLAIFSMKYPGRLMTIDEIPDLYLFLITNGYKIDTNFTEMFNQSEIKFNDKKVLYFVNYCKKN
jgi:hypothetical protein